ncbi:hypothetical protein LCGC14_0743190 [marine sediment metagenome]|uniref:Uncharacterized protein n=1 Tax=marine sediment metagenome TaxID=412755 RepID=A0A0F9QAA2_9ZZZZ
MKNYEAWLKLNKVEIKLDEAKSKNKRTGI